VSDLIKRSDAMAIAFRSPFFSNALMEELRAVPTADRPRGEWNTEYHGNGWNDYWDYTCSNCGKKYERADAVLYKANYCPNCGARMKGADDE
jgi:DNA-directed RNA polymerase subunit RPC12/RpoP